MTPQPAFVRKIRLILGKVQKRGGVSIGSETKDLPISLDQAGQRGTRTEVVIPWGITKQGSGDGAPGAESRFRVIVHDRVLLLPEYLRQDPYLGVCRGDERIEGLCVDEQGWTLFLGSVVDPGVVISGSQNHQHRSFGSDRLMDRPEDAGCSTFHGSDLAK